MSRTKTDLINRLGVELSYVGLGDSLAAEDIDYIDERSDEIIADLNGRKILYLADVNEIPDELFASLLDVIVMRMGKTPVAPSIIEYAEGRVKAASAPQAAQRTLSTDPMLRGGRSHFNGRLG